MVYDRPESIGSLGSRQGGPMVYDRRSIVGDDD
jgi:hypothetical protein